MIAGVDGYKRGWVAAIDLGNGYTDVAPFPVFSDLLAGSEPTLIAIDVPIGLRAKEDRRCDLLARKLLGRSRGSSVFPAPVQSMLKARSWEEACRIRLKVQGKRCSKQVVGIIPKIREVDRLMTPDLQKRVFECHPEVSFALMNSGDPMTFRKSTREGRKERVRLLIQQFPDVQENLSRVSGAASDIIDAYACLWTARRVLHGEAVRLPSDPEVNRRGLRAEIVA